MATGKERILFKRAWVHVFSKLEDHEAGQLIKHMLAYCDDQNPIPPNRLIEMVFEPIKQELKQDLRRWNEIVQQNKDKAAKRWGKNNQQQDAAASIGKQQQVSDADIDIEGDIDNDIDKKEIVVSANRNRAIDSMIPVEVHGKKRKVFKKPEQIDVEDYFVEKGFDRANAKQQSENFMDHYTSNGWKVGKNPMVDWEAAVRNWIKKRKEFQNGKQTNNNTGESRLERFVAGA